MWLDRALIYGPNLSFCINEKEYKKVLKSLGIKKSEANDFVGLGADATAHTFDRQDGDGLACVVCLSLPACVGKSDAEIFGILTHEAAHVWQNFVEYIGERDPSREFEAYSIQTISQRLFEAYESRA